MVLALPGLQHFSNGNMEVGAHRLDLELWQNQELIRRQNRLKYQFWDLLGKVGDQFSQEDLLQIHPQSKGKKLSQGNDLMGLPYQVLDIYRDFDYVKGLNIRLLNWYGQGVFILVLLGKDKFLQKDLASLSFKKCFWESPFEYEKLLEEAHSTNQMSATSFIQWYKRLPVKEYSDQCEEYWTEEIKKVIARLASSLGIPEN